MSPPANGNHPAIIVFRSADNRASTSSPWAPIWQKAVARPECPRRDVPYDPKKGAPAGPNANFGQSRSIASPQASAPERAGLCSGNRNNNKNRITRFLSQSMVAFFASNFYLNDTPSGAVAPYGTLGFPARTLSRPISSSKTSRMARPN